MSDYGLMSLAPKRVGNFSPALFPDFRRHSPRVSRTKWLNRALQ